MAGVLIGLPAHAMATYIRAVKTPFLFEEWPYYIAKPYYTVLAFAAIAAGACIAGLAVRGYLRHAVLGMAHGGLAMWAIGFGFAEWAVWRLGLHAEMTICLVACGAAAGMFLGIAWDSITSSRRRPGMRALIWPVGSLLVVIAARGVYVACHSFAAFDGFGTELIVVPVLSLLLQMSVNALRRRHQGCRPVGGTFLCAWIAWPVLTAAIWSAIVLLEHSPRWGIQRDWYTIELVAVMALLLGSNSYQMVRCRRDSLLTTRSEIVVHYVGISATQVLSSFIVMMFVASMRGT